MKMRLLVLMLAMALFLPGCYYSSGGYAYGYGYGTPSYDYYDLPTGYRYEYWNTGPVIVNALTGTVITLAALRAMYPRHHWRKLHREPNFVRDYRIPAHRHMWGLRHKAVPPHRGSFHRPQPPKHHMQMRPNQRPQHRQWNRGNNAPHRDFRNHERQGHRRPDMRQGDRWQHRQHQGAANRGAHRGQHREGAERR